MCSVCRYWIPIWTFGPSDTLYGNKQGTWLYITDLCPRKTIHPFLNIQQWHQRRLDSLFASLWCVNRVVSPLKQTIYTCYKVYITSMFWASKCVYSEELFYLPSGQLSQRSRRWTGLHFRFQKDDADHHYLQKTCVLYIIYTAVNDSFFPWCTIPTELELRNIALYGYVKQFVLNCFGEDLYKSRDTISWTTWPYPAKGSGVFFWNRHVSTLPVMLAPAFSFDSYLVCGLKLDLHLQSVLKKLCSNCTHRFYSETVDSF